MFKDLKQMQPPIKELQPEELNVRLVQFLIDNQEILDKLQTENIEQFNLIKNQISEVFLLKFKNDFQNIASSGNHSELIRFLTMIEANRTYKKHLKDSTLVIFEQVNVQIETYKQSLESKKGCYIATMAYGDYDHPQVIELRKFRDELLSITLIGRSFIKFYYKYSPSLVKKLKHQQIINLIIRKILNNFIKIIK